MDQGIYKEQKISHLEWSDQTSGISTLEFESFHLLATLSLFLLCLFSISE